MTFFKPYLEHTDLNGTVRAVFRFPWRFAKIDIRPTGEFRPVAPPPLLGFSAFAGSAKNPRKDGSSTFLYTVWRSSSTVSARTVPQISTH